MRIYIIFIALFMKIVSSTKTEEECIRPNEFWRCRNVGDLEDKNCRRLCKNKQYPDNPNPKPNGYSLVVASIRDESFTRPARQCHFWENNPDIVGGMDFEEGRKGGTWLAMHTSGKIAALLNVLRPLDESVDARNTRGFITVNYLESNLDGPNYIKYISPHSKEFDGFILVTIDLNLSNREIVTSYFTNLDDGPESINPSKGFFAFGNSLPNEPWKKVEIAKKRFEKILHKYSNMYYKDNLVKELFKMMQNDKEYFPDDRLLRDGNGLDEDYLRKLSSLYVKMPDILFGSRTHTIILVDGKGNVDYVENTMQEPIEEITHDSWVKTSLRFGLQKERNNSHVPLPRL